MKRNLPTLAETSSDWWRFDPSVPITVKILSTSVSIPEMTGLAAGGDYTVA